MTWTFCNGTGGGVTDYFGSPDQYYSTLCLRTGQVYINNGAAYQGSSC